MEYALIGTFNEGLENHIRGVWNELQEKGISNYGFEVEGKTPHITFADFEVDDISEMIVQLEFIRRQIKPMRVLFTTTKQFPNTTTLYYPCLVTKELATAHFLIQTTMKKFILENSFYVPGKWIPHATIASRLEDKINEAKDLFQEKFILNGFINKLVLIKMEERIDNIPQGFSEVWSATL